MKFVYFGYDFMLSGVKRLIEDGHELIGVFTFDCDNVFNFNRETLLLAKEQNVLSVLSPPNDVHLSELLDMGAEVFLAAGYPFKIPPIDEARAYAINMHPSLLPKGRGIMPTPYIIKDHPEASGVSVHKLTEQFDQGDILYQEVLPLNEGETVETLTARMAMRGPKILSMIMADLPKYWNEAKPQDESEALHFPPPSDDMRILDWSLPVQEIDKTGRAFGRFGSLAQLGDQLWVVYDYSVWEEEHDLEPGTVATEQNQDMVIAAKDGFVCLKEFQIAKQA